MFDLRRFRAMSVVSLGLAMLLPTHAFAVDLTGAWATDRALCDRIFTKKQNQTTFSDLSDLYGSGFIIDGNRITGKTVRCTIKSRKEEGDAIQLSAACATTIMTSNVEFNLKMTDATSISRQIPGIEGMQLNYQRCSL
jgi:hypothetical protein